MVVFDAGILLLLFSPDVAPPRNPDTQEPVERIREKIDYLVDKNIIRENEELSWHAIRHLRNEASHPKRQSIVMPGMMISMLEDISGKINSLFI